MQRLHIFEDNIQRAVIWEDECEEFTQLLDLFLKLEVRKPLIVL
jgi:hypothetical protein